MFRNNLLKIISILIILAIISSKALLKSRSRKANDVHGSGFIPPITTADLTSDLLSQLKGCWNSASREMDWNNKKYNAKFTYNFSGTNGYEASSIWTDIDNPTITTPSNKSNGTYKIEGDEIMLSDANGEVRGYKFKIEKGAFYLTDSKYTPCSV